MTVAEAWDPMKKQRERERFGCRVFFFGERKVRNIEKFGDILSIFIIIYIYWSIGGGFCKFTCMKSTGRANDF